MKRISTCLLVVACFVLLSICQCTHCFQYYLNKEVKGSFVSRELPIFVVVKQDLANLCVVKCDLHAYSKAVIGSWTSRVKC